MFGKIKKFVNKDNDIDKQIMKLERSIEQTKKVEQMLDLSFVSSMNFTERMLATIRRYSSKMELSIYRHLHFLHTT